MIWLERGERVAPPTSRSIARALSGLSRHCILMCLLEDHILQELLGDGILLLDGAVGTTFLPRHHTGGLWGEQHTTGGDVLSTAVLSFPDTDAGEAHLEDADAVQLHLLSQLEEVLHGTAQLVEHGYDVRTLDRCLGLDELRKLLGSDETLVVDSLGEVLA